MIVSAMKRLTSDSILHSLISAFLFVFNFYVDYSYTFLQLHNESSAWTAEWRAPGSGSNWLFSPFSCQPLLLFWRLLSHFNEVSVALSFKINRMIMNCKWRFSALENPLKSRFFFASGYFTHTLIPCLTFKSWRLRLDGGEEEAITLWKWMNYAAI